MLKIILAQPLVSVMLVAGLVRLVAVVWSEGFIQSDDHFDTIAVAFDWLGGGLWGGDQFLRWKQLGSETIGRFPLYTLLLWLTMKVSSFFGATSLSSMMYLIRGLHALVSLLPVLVIYDLVRRETGSKRWAVFGGMLAALNFASPFLGVRNLIETVGGNIWIVAIYGFYRYRGSTGSSGLHHPAWLYLAAVMSALAWMMRFQIAFAILPIPFILWYEHKRIVPALQYSLVVGLMLLASGLFDYLLLGRFAGSTLTNLTINTDLPSLYNTIPMLYPALILLLLVPPFSVVALWWAGRPAFFLRHKLLCFSFLSFLICHWLHPNQQERFIYPMLPVLLLMATLAVWQKYNDTGYLLKSRRLITSLAGVSLGLNLLLLVPLTVAYSHKGMIEPLKWLETKAPDARVLFIQPQVKRWMPVEYGGNDLSWRFVRSWSEWATVRSDDNLPGSFDYLVLYPPLEADLPRYLDSARIAFGPLEEVLRVDPSLYDWLLHRANPGHNDRFAAYVYRTSPEVPAP